MEFVCGHCGGASLWLVDASEKIVKVECLSCGKESVVERATGSMPPAKAATSELAARPLADAACVSGPPMRKSAARRQ